MGKPVIGEINAFIGDTKFAMDFRWNLEFSNAELQPLNFMTQDLDVLVGNQGYQFINTLLELEDARMIKMVRSLENKKDLGDANVTILDNKGEPITGFTLKDIEVKLVKVLLRSKGSEVLKIQIAIKERNQGEE